MRPLIQSPSLPSFRISQVTIKEFLSQPYTIDIHGRCLDSSTLDILSLVGQPVTLTAEFQDNKRFFHGIISHCFPSAGHSTKDRHPLFTLQLTSPLTRLANTVGCEVYQDQSIVDTISELLKRFNIRFKIDLKTGQSTKLAYLTQFNQSYLDIFNQLLYGLKAYYFFEHDEQGPILIISNSPMTSKIIAQSLDLPSRSLSSNFNPMKDKQTLPIKALNLQDYYFDKKSANFEKKLVNQTNPKSSNSIKTHFNVFNQQLDIQQDSNAFAEKQLQQHTANQALSSGSSQKLALSPGKQFNDENQKAYFLLNVTHQFSQDTQENTLEESQTTAEKHGYTNQFEAMPTPRFYMVPQHVTNKVHGFLKARVTTEKPPETSKKMGQVYAKPDWFQKPDTVYLNPPRTGQFLASNQFGSHFIPRANDEILLGFKFGHPDLPEIVGSLYNVQNNPIDNEKNRFTQGVLSASLVNSQLKTPSSFIWEDNKGQQALSIQAGKDFSWSSEKNHTIKVKNQYTTTVNKTGKITSKKTVIFKSKESLKLQAGSSLIQLSHNSIDIKGKKISAN